MVQPIGPDHEQNAPNPSNPPQQTPMEFPRPPHEPGRTDPRAKPDPAKPSTRPTSDGERTRQQGGGDQDADD